MSPTHQLFKTASFEEGRESVVGFCNGLPMSERWVAETPLFAKAILNELGEGERTILDYGVGVGRLAKEVLQQRSDVRVIGVDDSVDQRRYAKMYVDDADRFQALAPQGLVEQVDMAYCVYVLQHVPAIELRDVIQRIHYYLKPGGKLVYCSSDYRMAIRFDAIAFFDDRCLGVDIRSELNRFFEPERNLFSEDDLREHEILRRMVRGEDGQGTGLPHPAIVYRRREINGPYCNGCL